jgi:prepilin-type N-terminal cleavage/methylation domain-containing protein
MKKTIRSISAGAAGVQETKGFTLVELLISMVVASVLVGAIYSSYVIQQKAYTVQRDLSRMENCLRAAMQIIRSDLLNAGRSGAMDGQYGIQDSRRYNQWNLNTLDTSVNGFQGLTLTMARDLGDPAAGNPPDSIADYTDPAALRTIQYRLLDTDNDGRRELYRIDNTYPAGAATVPAVPNGVLVCDCMDDVGFAFAVDRDHDEAIDRLNVPPLETTIWAVDANNDGNLETNLDGNASGTITPDDAGGVNIGTTVPLNDVRAVRVWLMARSARRDTNYHDGKVYQVGLKTIDPDTTNTAGFRRMLLSSTVTLRNRERKP